jgi:DNA-binding protein H-NS
MQSDRWKSMSVNELWTVHEEITAILREKIEAEKADLEEQLHELEPQPRSRSAQLRYGKKLDDFLIN